MLRPAALLLCAALAGPGISVAPPAAAAPACPVYLSASLRVPDAGSPHGFRTVLVQRPAGADSPRIPVIYLLHGFPGTPSDFVGSGVVTALERAACAQGRSVVLAEPDGTAGHLDAEWADDVDGRVDLETFVTGPVITAVEGAAVRSRSRRTIAGFSMGGFGAAAIGLRHPDLYQRVISLAGYFHLDDPDHVFGNTRSVYRRHQPDVIATPAHQGFLLIDGADDQLQLTTGETPRFTKVLQDRHIPVTTRIIAGGHEVALLAHVAPAVVRYTYG